MVVGLVLGESVVRVDQEYILYRVKGFLVLVKAVL